MTDGMELRNSQLPFAMIPHYLINEVSHSAYRLFGVMQLHAGNHDGRCWASQETMASESGLSVRTVQRCLKELEHAGAITIKPRFVNGKQVSNLYELQRTSRADTGVAPLPDMGVAPSPDTGVAQTRLTSELENKGARKAPAPTSELVGYYVDQYRKATGVDPHPSWKAAAGREAKRALEAFSEVDVKRGLYFAAHQSRNPGGLLSYISEYHRARRSERRPTR
jgi:DNA-binding Lrp family transcriptional regulator